MWIDGQLVVFNSAGMPLVSRGGNQFLPFDQTDAVALDAMNQIPVWMEAIWQDEDGTLFGWYHHEPGGLCGASHLTAPFIGAMVSLDGGRSFTDLGPVLVSGDPSNCDARNGYFASGHGDFSVIAYQKGDNLSFLFSNYGGAGPHRGVAHHPIDEPQRVSQYGNARKY